MKKQKITRRGDKKSEINFVHMMIISSFLASKHNEMHMHMGKVKITMYDNMLLS